MTCPYRIAPEHGCVQAANLSSDTLLATVLQREQHGRYAPEHIGVCFLKWSALALPGFFVSVLQDKSSSIYSIHTDWKRMDNALLVQKTGDTPGAAILASGRSCAQASLSEMPLPGLPPNEGAKQSYSCLMSAADVI